MKARRSSLPYVPPESYCPVLPVEAVGSYSNHGKLPIIHPQNSLLHPQYLPTPTTPYTTPILQESSLALSRPLSRSTRIVDQWSGHSQVRRPTPYSGFSTGTARSFRIPPPISSPAACLSPIRPEN